MVLLVCRVLQHLSLSYTMAVQWVNACTKTDNILFVSLVDIGPSIYNEPAVVMDYSYVMLSFTMLNIRVEEGDPV